MKGQSEMFARGSRLKPDWQPDKDDRLYASDRGFPDFQISEIAEDFRDYWLARPGAKAVKVDWHATWRTWVRRCKPQVQAPRPVKPSVGSRDHDHQKERWGA